LSADTPEPRSIAGEALGRDAILVERTRGIAVEGLERDSGTPLVSEFETPDPMRVGRRAAARLVAELRGVLESIDRKRPGEHDCEVAR
jgi:hypothetical protein